MRDFVTVVSGVPRSGTSLVMQVLAAGGVPPLRDDARPPDAHNPRGYFEYAPVKRLARDAAWVADARGRAVKVIHALVPALPAGPRYRLLLVRRDLREVVASQAAMLAPGSPERDALADARWVEIFAAELGSLETSLRARPGFRVLPVEHARLLAAPAAVAAEIDVFLGGGLDRGAMAAAVDPALHRQRRAD